MQKTRKVLVTLLSVFTVAAASLGVTSCKPSLDDSSTTDSSSGNMEPTREEGVIYEISSDGTYAEVVGFEGTETELIIADSYEGLPVKIIEKEAFYKNRTMTSVIIPDSVTSIGEDAFFFCDNLTSVKIGDGVTSIGDRAFAVCLSLMSVVIPSNVTSIGEGAFNGCNKLVEVVNKSTHIAVKKGGTSNGWVGYYALSVDNSGDTFESKLSKDNDHIIYTDGEEKILVGYTGTETDLVFPDYVTEIYQTAFRYCDSLTSVKIPDSVTSIGEWAFYGCRNLTNVVIPDNVTSIGDLAFQHCYSLTSVVIPDSVTSIGGYAFDSCYSLTSVYYKGTASEWSAVSIGLEAFYNTNATRYYYSETAPTEEGNYWHYVDGEVTVW